MDTGSTEVKGETYEFFHLPIKKALSLSHRLGRYIGGPLAKAGIDGELNIPAALKDFFEACPEDEFIQFCMDVLSTTLVGGKKLSDSVQFNAHFAGKPGLVLQVVVEACKFHFSDFFEGLQPFLEQAEVQKVPGQEKS